MDAVKNFLAKDWVKVVGFFLGTVAGVLVVKYPPPNPVGNIAGIVFAVCASLGFISGGTSGLRSDAARSSSSQQQGTP